MISGCEIAGTCDTAAAPLPCSIVEEKMSSNVGLGILDCTAVGGIGAPTAGNDKGVSLFNPNIELKSLVAPLEPALLATPLVP